MVTDRLNTLGEYFDPNVLGIPTPPSTNPVDHPHHYNAGKVEVIDYIEQVAAFYPNVEAPLIGNVIKYVSRAPLKGKKLEDLKKAQWYLNRLISKLEKD